ncbi:MAG: DUF2232 domain-containing protein [Candidatus Sedimenticola sp. (ex Thyasira tokunagai)]
MHGLASLAMRSRVHAVMMVAVLAILSILFPPASILSTALVALVTLRSGASAGAVLLLLASAAGGVLALLLFGSVMPIVGFVLLMWLPLMLLALLLRGGRSLALALQGALVLSLLMLASQYLQSEDPVTVWRTLLAPFVETLVEAQIVVATEQALLVDRMAEWMPGVVVAGFFLQLMVTLLLARWWQAKLYNPGGFRSEFHQLRLPRYLLIATLLYFGLVMMIGSGALEFRYITMLLLSGWFLGGLALVHGTVYRMKMGIGWLIGVYLLLVMAMPHMIVLLAAAGMADGWFDFRARIRSVNGPNE